MPRFLIFISLLSAFALTAQGQPDTLRSDDFMLKWQELHQNFEAKMGQPATPFDVKDFRGNRHSSEQYRGKVLVVYFWNIWDWDSCERQTQALNRIAEQHGSEVAIVSFVRETVQLGEFAFLQEHPVKFPIVPNSHDFGMAYHGYLLGTPLVFFIDREGAWRRFGKDAEAFEGWVEELLDY